MNNGKSKRPDFSEPMEMGSPILTPNRNALDGEALKQLKAMGETARELRDDLLRLSGEGSSLNGRRYTHTEAFGEGGWTGMSITGPRF